MTDSSTPKGAPKDTPKGVALITGAADRLGAALAHALAATGYRVIIHYATSADKARALVSKIAATGRQAASVQADLTKRADRSTLIAKAAAPFGPLSVLVNNASIYEKDSPQTLDEVLWDQHFAIHAEAPVFLARDFAAQLPENTEGNIVNIIDERILHPTPASFSYNLSKSVLWTATQTLAQNLAPRIRVNAIGPGPILPEAGQSPQSFAARNTKSLLGSVASPDDVVKTLLFLLDSPAITGQMLAIDGGEHLSWSERRGPTPRQK